MLDKGVAVGFVSRDAVEALSLADPGMGRPGRAMLRAAEAQ